MVNVYRIVAAASMPAGLAIALVAMGSPRALDTEAPFLAENRAAMDRMMTGMNAKPSGDVDGDFAAMMVPHHQGAIDMARAELHYGRNERLRRIAQQIIVEQQQEIIAMRAALDGPPSKAAATAEPPQSTRDPAAVSSHP
jgi:hypothetical protein